MTFVADLFTPEAQANAYEWAAVLLAHAFVGAVLFAALAVIMRHRPRALPCAAQASAAVYALWEVLVQRLGAGIGDALVDWLAVVCGALIAWGAWTQAGRRIVAALVIIVATGAAGVWRRRP